MIQTLIPPPACHMQVDAPCVAEIEIIRNRLGECWAQYVLPCVSDQDARLRRRGIDPRGPVKFIGESQA